MGNIVFWIGLVGAVLSMIGAFWFIFKEDNASATKGFIGIVVFGLVALGGLYFMPEKEEAPVTEDAIEQSTELDRGDEEEEDIEGTEDTEEDEEVIEEEAE